MERKNTITFVFLAVFLFSLIGGQTPLQAESETRSRPNIVFLLVDDLGWADINVNDPLNRSFYETPNIDRLARQGIRFTNAYANAANCAPTRAALMSGKQYPNQPIYTVNTGARGKRENRELKPVSNRTQLPDRFITLAEALRSGGYTTGFMGKWHLGDPPDLGPKQQGFDVNVGGYGTGRPSWSGGYFRPDNNPYIDDASREEYLTDFLTRKAVSFIEDHRDHPFYLQLSYYTVHTPLQAPDQRKRKYKQKQPDRGHRNPTYAAMIDSLDRSVGRILETLDQQGLSENTIVIFTSDNGGLGGYRDIGVQAKEITDNGPLKAGKGSFYEGGIRVPLIARWPGVVPADSQSHEPVITTDFYPTLLEATGVSNPKGYELDGESFLPVLKEPGSSLDRNPLYWHFPGYLQGQGGTWRTTPVSVIRHGPWKLLKYYEGNHTELYNLNRDLSEQQDRSRNRTDVRTKLQKKLRGWLNGNDAPLPKKKE